LVEPRRISFRIEVIPGAKTAPQTTAAMTEIVKKIGHLPVLIKRTCRASSRTGCSIPSCANASIWWSRADRPRCARHLRVLGIGYKLAVVGPMALLDMAGLDIYQGSAAT